MSAPLLQVEDLVACYGGIAALKGISLGMNQGEIVAIIGANGAGKTTLLSVISGLLVPRRGRLWLDGHDVTGLPAERVVRLGIAHVPERRQVFAGMSVEENLLLGAYHRLRHESRRQIQTTMDEMTALFPVLAERKRQLAGTLSGGQQQMLAIARGLMARPRLLLLDEPSLGLAPMIAREIFDTIRTLPQRGTAVLLVEQNARAALRLASRCYVLETGAVAFSGHAADLLSDPRVRGAYLGERNGHSVPFGEPSPVEPLPVASAT
jgi:branched-chain amino acid transport system ATP-binding protein